MSAWVSGAMHHGPQHGPQRRGPDKLIPHWGVPRHLSDACVHYAGSMPTLEGT